jgi:hypothetical protein
MKIRRAGSWGSALARHPVDVKGRVAATKAAEAAIERDVMFTSQ